MRNPERIHRILHKLEKLWKHVPDYRFYQMLNAIGFDSRRDFFYLEDDDFEKVLDKIIEDNA